MKKIIGNNPIIAVATYFATVITLAIFMTSCATGYVGCDAYGSVDKKPGISHQVMTPERAEEMSK